MIRFASVCLVAFVTAFVCAPVCFAQNKNSKSKSSQEKRDDQKIQNEKQDVKEAQDQLKDDQKEFQDAQKALAEAEGREKAARQRQDEVRKRIEVQAEKNSGIDKALAEQYAAKRTYDEAASPVLKSFKQTKEYQTAIKKVDEAKARLKTLREDTSPNAETKRQEIGQASKDALAASELETKALEGDSTTKSARAKLADAQDRVNQIRVKIRNTIDADPEIKSAVQAMRAAADASEAADKMVQRIRDKIAADTAKLAREQQQVRQAELQDKQNDGKNNNKIKKNNKGKK